MITVDFETYYSQTYSLSKITTEEYIRGDEYETIGVAVKVDDGVTEWFSGTHKETKAWLKKFDWDTIVVAHNAMFDMAILNWRFDIRPRIIADTLAMARALHGSEVGGSLAKLVEHYGLGAKGTEVVNALGKHRMDFDDEALARYGEYCINDVDLTYALFNQMVQHFTKDELKIIDLTTRMFTEPVLELDALLLERHKAALAKRKDALLARVSADDPEKAKDIIMSNAKFAELLRQLGVEPPMKISATTGKETYAFAKTDEGLKALLEHENLEVQTLATVRLGVKSTLEETRTQRFLDIASRGNLPIPLRYYAAHTGRWGGTDKINMQNLPSRGPDAGTLKKAVLAPEGYVIIDADSSQIEARVLAWMAGQEDLLETFRKNDHEKRTGVLPEEQEHDVYKIMASRIYNKPIGQINKTERFVGKTVVLGAGYGLGGKKFAMFMKQSNIELSHDEATHIVNTYRESYPCIPKLWRDGDACIQAMIEQTSREWGQRPGIIVAGDVGINRVSTPVGIPMHYHNLRFHTAENGKRQAIYNSRTGITSIWGGTFTENMIQHLARCIIAKQMLRIARKYRVVMTVHDAIAIIAPEEEAVQAQTYVEDCMRWLPSWADGLPLNCESGFGKTYGDC
jgi:DNA polymerase I-like protein with 3'-5' exonuclease and polymerase domains